MAINNTTNGTYANGTQTNGHTSNDQSPEPIAIIGIGCRLPGDSDSSHKLWELLSAGTSAQSRFPPSRFNIDGFYHANSDRPGSLNTAGGYFINEDLRHFENSFFGINNLEATYMDPQQRKLLEAVFECFENAGFSLEQVSGANVGCYVGNFVTDFITMQLKESEYTHRYSATGLGTTILANRISHVFNLQGPSFVIDTACSSSLYCLHAACTALLARECDSAIVAGANLIQSPEQQLATMKAGVLSKTSTCHTFDSSADGYGRADGIGALLVKRLSDAIRDGDPIRCVVRGTAINSNGKTNGITLPSADGQEAVIRKAYAQAKLSYDETDYVECHGTGTAVGDPIEVEAVSRVFKKPQGSPMLIGSVKTNLGHSEAASGISSIIKVALALEKGVIPPTIGVKNINPKIKIDEWNVKIVTEMTPWPENIQSTSGTVFRRAGVNSFGYGGANAHCILEAPQMHVPQTYLAPTEIVSLPRSKLLLPLSASNEESLERRASDLAGFVTQNTSILDLAHTLGARRSHLAVRGYLLAGQNTLREDLTAANLKKAISDKPYSKLPLTFVFTGQGAQWAEMGRELMEEFPTFRRCIDMLDNTLQMLEHAPSWTLKAAILEPAATSKINLASRSQPVCTAVQIAIVQLLSEWGIFPEYVLGHSSGEIAAAYTAGRITAQQSIIIAYYRGYTVTKSARQGVMMAAGLGTQKAQEQIESLGLGKKIRVACVNSPESVTISGDSDGIDELKKELDRAGTFARVLKTDGKAYHSHHMAEIGQEYQDYLVASLSQVTDQPLADIGVQWISSVTEEMMDGPVDASYWRGNLESPVLFSNVVEKLLKFTASHMIEIGPHSALALPIKQVRTKLNMGENKVHYGSAITRGQDSVMTLLNLVGDLYLHGHTIAFKDVNFVDADNPKQKSTGPQGKMLLDLPKYTWDYSATVFNEPRVSVEWRNRKYPHHDLLGSQVHGGSGITSSWRNILKVKNVPWIEGHKLDQTVVFPAAGYIAMAIEAIAQTEHIAAEDLALKLRDVTIDKALILPDEETDTGVEIFTVMQPTETTGSASWYQFNISSYIDGIATTHAKGKIQRDAGAKAMKSRIDIDAASMAPSVARTWYKKFATTGLNFQGQFQSLTEINSHRKNEKMQILAGTELRQGGGSGMTAQSNYAIHPVTIDSLLQAGIIASTSGVVRTLASKVPVQIDEISICNPSESAKEHKINAVSEPVGFGTIRISAELRDEQNKVALQINNCRLAAYSSGNLQEAADERHPMLRVVWKPDVDLLRAGDDAALGVYMEHFVAANSDSNGAAARAGAILDLMVHKNPRARVLSLKDGAESYLTELLRLNTPFKRCETLHQRVFAEDGTTEIVEISAEGASAKKSSGKQTFDIVYGVETADIAELQDLAGENGVVICEASSGDAAKLQELGYTLIQAPSNTEKSIILANPPASKSGRKDSLVDEEVVIVGRNSEHELNKALMKKVHEVTQRHTRYVSLEHATVEEIGENATVITTIELENPVLSRATAEEFKAVKVLTDNCSNLIWVTGGSVLDGSQPEFGVANGLSRALMLEQPSLRFFVVDLDVASTPLGTSASQVVDVFQQAMNDPTPDFEFCQAKGMIHVSRFIPEEDMNRVFRQKQGTEQTTLPLAEAKPARLGSGVVGQTEGNVFRCERPNATPLAPGEVEVEVQAVGLSTRDVQMLNGDGETSNPSCTSQFSGRVTKVGAAVQNFSIGDTVVAMTSGYFATSERVPEWACQKLKANEDVKELSRTLVPLSTAIYAIHDRARLQSDESIIVCCGNESSSSAAIYVAQDIGAQVTAIVSTEAEGQQIMDKFNLPQSQVLVEGAQNFEAKISQAVGSDGADVVVSYGKKNTISHIESALASCCRLVIVGKASQLDTSTAIMRKNATISRFDTDAVINTSKKVRSRLIVEALSLYRRGYRHASVPLQTFDVSELSEALRAVQSRSRQGDVVISLENDQSSIPVLPLKHDTTFSPEKSYLLVGCLGGLGRSMSKWMFARGARKFVFIGRSGTDRTPARRLVEDLELSGAQVTVVRGDVINYSDVERAVEGIEGPIGGVIQAAMGLDEALFTTMPRDYWLTGLMPKIQGSWNLHNAIKGRDQELEFFLMTSSVSGSVGTATESNYCSANYFLDVFARHRRSLGLPATSVGLGMISEVGYLHENPEIEALLLRKGIQAINEDEMLQILDCALSTQTTVPGWYDELASGHVLTGLEPLGLKELRKQGFEGTSPVLGDPRASLLSAALDDGTDSAASGSNSGLPAEVAQAIEAGASVDAAVLNMLAKKFSNLVLVPVEKLNPTRPISDVGVDSMLGAEFRAWIFQAFKVDVPYLTLLSAAATLNMLSEMIAKQLSASE